MKLCADMESQALWMDVTKCEGSGNEERFSFVHENAAGSSTTSFMVRWLRFARLMVTRPTAI